MKQGTEKQMPKNKKTLSQNFQRTFGMSTQFCVMNL